MLVYVLYNGQLKDRIALRMYKMQAKIIFMHPPDENRIVTPLPTFLLPSKLFRLLSSVARYNGGPPF